jgi:polysaccharide deacetylase 2 family uncharacterized protein YibQ
VAKAKKRIKRKKHSRHIIFILILLVAGTLFLIKDIGRDNSTKKIPAPRTPWKASKPAVPAEPAKPVNPDPALPSVAIVIDDLGPNKNAAERVLALNAPLTLSILPQEVYSAWVAGEGHRLGLDVIGHIPLQAKKPLRLGNGGLYLQMSKKEMSRTLAKNFDSIPHIVGISTHMGSAFTEDKRAMNILVSELKKHRLFLLDSITTPKSLGLEVSKSHGVSAVRRDVFLDDSNNPADIKTQWNRLLKIASKKGFAVAQAHPIKNTISFLKKTLSDNKDVKVVPLSELIEQQ